MFKYFYINYLLCDVLRNVNAVYQHIPESESRPELFTTTGVVIYNSLLKRVCFSATLNQFNELHYPQRQKT